MTLQVANSAIMPQPPTQFATLTDVISYEGDFNRAVQSELATILRAINANIYTPGGNLATLDALASVANLTTLANQSAAAKVWTDVNDGSGSGLDADTLDGHDTGYFQQALGFIPANVAGDTFTGFVTVAPASGDARVVTRKAASGSISGILGYTGNNARWFLALGDASTESGSDTGSAASLYHYSDTGAFLGTAFSFNRATGLGTVAGDPTTALGIATKQYVDNNFAALAGGFTFSGAVTFGSNSTSFAGPGSGNVSIELGGHGYSNAAFIDFHSGATDVDYDSRIIATGGTGAAGGGGLTFDAVGLFWTGTVAAANALVNKSYVDSVVTTPDYGAGNAALSAGGIGTYALAQRFASGSTSFGGTIAGSSLRLVTLTTLGSSSLSGTWRLMSWTVSGSAGGFTGAGCGLWLRIA